MTRRRGLKGGKSAKANAANQASSVTTPDKNLTNATKNTQVSPSSKENRDVDKGSANRTIIYLGNRADLAAKAEILADAVPFRQPYQ